MFKIHRRNIHTVKRSLIWVYNITNLSEYSQVKDCLVEGTPFKTECANVLNTTRGTVTSYLDSGKILKNKWILSSKVLSKENLLNFLTPKTVWEVVTGELLGDGHISYDPINKPLINGRLEFTFSASILHYVNYLKFNFLAFICTASDPTPWPNPVEGKTPTQYWFSTKRSVAITNLHSIWYKKNWR